MKPSNGTCTHDGGQLCHIILKSINNCRSYGPGKFHWRDTCMQAWTHTHIPNCSCNNYVSLTASELDKYKLVHTKKMYYNKKEDLLPAIVGVDRPF